jgi:hypothetical protein
MRNIITFSEGSLRKLARPRGILLATALALASMLAMTVTSTQIASAAPPPGYAGPMANCPGTLRATYPLRSASGATLGSTLNIWYSTSNGGTLCAKTYDNLTGSHHMEVVVRRADWQTAWSDSDTYATYAGGIAVYGMQKKCAWVFGRVQVNGVNYEARVKVRGPEATC